MGGDGIRRAGLLLAAWLVAASAAGCKAADDDDEARFACRYDDPLFHQRACKEYRGDWSEQDAKVDCSATFSTQDFVGTLSAGACEAAGVVGSCEVPVQGSRRVTYRFYDLTGDQTAVARTRCQNELGGAWQAGESGPDGGVVDEACKQLHADALAAMVSSDEVKVTPECQDDACLKQLVADRGWIAFRPRKATPSAGLIFYPGAAVDPRVYAPILRGVARAGYLVALVPMPGNMALSGSDRADDVMAGNATPADWFLAGHSLGGIAVLAYVKEHPATSKGFIHWASYGTTEYDIHDVDIPGASIYGARDGRSTVQEVKDGAAFLPAKTSFVRLEGANHAQFGHLCRSEQDQKPDISLEQQHALVQGATVQLMQRALSGDWTTHGGFAKATVEAGLWCQKAQRVLFNPSGDDLPVEKIANQVSTDTTAFSKSSAGIVAKAVSVQTLIRQGANPASLSAPAVIEGEVWCKMKSQDAVAKELGLTPAGAEGSCAEVNKAALAWALSQLSAEELAAYKASGKTLSFLPDEDTKSGPSWILSKMQFKQSTASPGTYELRSTRIMVGDDPAVPEAKRQVYYCKLWAPARALLWALAQR